MKVCTVQGYHEQNLHKQKYILLNFSIFFIFVDGCVLIGKVKKDNSVSLQIGELWTKRKEYILEGNLLEKIVKRPFCCTVSILQSPKFKLV